MPKQVEAPTKIQYRNAAGKIVVERVKAVSGRDYITASGKIVSPTRVLAEDWTEPRRSKSLQQTIREHGGLGRLFPKPNPHGRGKPPLVRTLGVPERHQLRIARDTLRLKDEMVGVMGGPSKAEAREIIYRLTGRRENPKRPRRTKRLLAKQRDYAFFRKSSVAGIAKPSETALRANQLADAERWAYGQDVDFRYYYGRDADENAESEWDGRIDAVHLDGTIGSAYGNLGNDYSKRHVKAEAVLDLMALMGATGRRRRNVGVTLTRAPGHRIMRKGRNPPLAILGNPPLTTFGDVTRIEYRHRHDGRDYYHDFQKPVQMRRTKNGRVVLSQRNRKPIVKLFEVPKA
jgi:hypothetical protein